MATASAAVEDDTVAAAEPGRPNRPLPVGNEPPPPIDVPNRPLGIPLAGSDMASSPELPKPLPTSTPASPVSPDEEDDVGVCRLCSGLWGECSAKW